MAGGPQRFADTLGRLGVLRGVAQKHCSGGFRQLPARLVVIF